MAFQVGAAAKRRVAASRQAIARLKEVRQGAHPGLFRAGPPRRILRKIGENLPDQLGDITTLADPGVVKSLVDERLIK